MIKLSEATMRCLVAALIVMCCSTTAPAASTRTESSRDLQGTRIGIHLPVFPEFALVPGYPVYYAPRVDLNCFFYDGEYWVFADDNWYASDWYDGPWQFVQRELVPPFVLRIPVRYYLHPPTYFRGWREDDAPRWGEHWGTPWEKRRIGWATWDRAAVPARAPLPLYQRHYSGARYPHQQQARYAIRSQNYAYVPRERVTQQHFLRRDREPDSQAQSNATSAGGQLAAVERRTGEPAPPTRHESARDVRSSGDERRQYDESRHPDEQRQQYDHWQTNDRRSDDMRRDDRRESELQRWWWWNQQHRGRDDQRHDEDEREPPREATDNTHSSGSGQQSVSMPGAGGGNRHEPPKFIGARKEEDHR